MQTGWRYRVLAIIGAVTITVFSVVAANMPAVQTLVTSLPILENLRPVSYRRGDLIDEVMTATVVGLAALWPLFKPQSRRILDTITFTYRRIFLIATALATLGYFDWSSRLPRTTLIMTVMFLSVALPMWFVYIRRQPTRSQRAVIVGDDKELMTKLLHAADDLTILGIVSPPSATLGPGGAEGRYRVSDGGQFAERTGGLESLPRLGGLSRLEDVLVEHEVDTVLLGFQQPDREDFFGTLLNCYENGVEAKVLREQADSVLASEPVGEELVETDLEPWDWQDYVLKRLFDIAFAGIGLLLLSPLILLIGAVIRLDSPGPILYSQLRTAEFGERFTIYKFRSMLQDAEGTTGARLSEEDAGGVDPRVTRVGRVLRRTHLDEIPQLWSILVGDMSVVGPRPERPELDADIETTVSAWQSRWFVKPGLTGLAQINGMTGHEPEKKLRYDIQYIRNQSFWFDLKIVIRQVFQVCLDAVSVVDEPKRGG